MKKIPYFVTTFVFLFLLFGMGLWTLLSPDPSFVASERRSAAPMPSINAKGFLDGKLGKDVESYFLDSLPPREALRRLQTDRIFSIASSFRPDTFRLRQFRSRPDTDYPPIP